MNACTKTFERPFVEKTTTLRTRHISSFNSATTTRQTLHEIATKPFAADTTMVAPTYEVTMLAAVFLYETKQVGGTDVAFSTAPSCRP